MLICIRLISAISFIFISSLLISVPLAFTGDKISLLIKAPEPRYELMSEDNFGLVPPPVNLSHIGRKRTFSLGRLEEPPSRYDLRELGKTTPVENQNPCGTCWSFATTSSLESRILVEDEITYDLSEQCIVACNVHDTGCNTGGNMWIASNYLFKKGSHLELDYGYTCPAISCGNPDCICMSAPVKSLTGWRLVCADETDTDAIKNAVYNYGGLYCAMYASFPGFSGYDGSSVLCYTGDEECTHAVTIVGWDDSLTSPCGSGAWIAKNSWGTLWGDNGYFYIAYGSARIGTNASYLCYKSYDPQEKLYYYDDNGWVSAAGYPDSNIAWGAVRFESAEPGDIQSVDFWAVDDDMSYDIYIYDSWMGNAPVDLLYSQTGGSLTEAGYYSIMLTSPVEVTLGDEFVVVIRFTASDYNYPVPIDTDSPITTNKCYLSSDGSSWEEIGAGSGWDLGIRAKILSTWIDSDSDGILDDEDNCPLTPNGPDLGTCVKEISGLFISTGVNCENDTQCESGETCDVFQGNHNGNDIGDACECYADIDGDGYVYPSDLSVFLTEYGRTDCLTNPPCEADFDGDGNVYPSDLSVFIAEYGREDCDL